MELGLTLRIVQSVEKNWRKKKGERSSREIMLPHKFFWEILYGQNKYMEVPLNDFPKFKKALSDKVLLHSTYKLISYTQIGKAFPFFLKYMPGFGFYIQGGKIRFPSIEPFHSEPEEKTAERFKSFLRALKENGYDNFE